MSGLDLGQMIAHGFTRRNATETLTNKTLTAPIINGARSGSVWDIADRATIAPTLDLDFASQRYRVFDGAVGLREIALSDILTYTGSGRTYTGARGTLIAQSANAPRITFDPVTGAGLGLSVWSARTNLFLNSLVDGTSLATQSVTLTAVEHRLSFYGTGTVTLSGSATGTVTGAGAYPARTGLTFTPTAGSVTFTVTGSVQFAMLTTGSTDSPFIPTAGAAVTAPADVPSITGSNFSKWFNQSEGTMVVIARNSEVPPSNRFIWALSDGTIANYLSRRVVSSGSIDYLGVGPALNTVDDAPATGITTPSAAAWSPSGFAHSTNGAPVVSTAYTGLPPVINQLQLGGLAGGSVGATLISRVLYFPRALPSNLQALSA